jgi:leucyl/phenylalanyl-tRNA--protein transferase
MITILNHNTPFPPLERALRQPNGLLAAGGNLTTARLLDAYRQGIFPWFNRDDPILWWSPDPRMVLIPDQFNISHSLRKTLRSKLYEVRTDTAFEQVMLACASPREGQAGTWIHDEMIAAYTELHRQGYAHSVETWHDDKLVGGLYGLAVGRMFYGESMFSRRNDASKVALAHLCAQLHQWNFGMIDCQMTTPHLVSLGAHEIPRKEFIQRLQELVNYSCPHPQPDSKWHFDHEPVA